MALLQNDLWPTALPGRVGCGAISETRSIPSRSDIIASCFLELERLNQELKSKLRDDFLSILNGMGNLSLSSDERPPSPSPTPPSRSLSLSHGTPFITEAYSWLLENIANPYPSPTVKASLAQRFNCSLSSINSWFINARRRIGWTMLCRDHFNNCRADTLDAAHRALVEEDPNRLLPADIIHAFISVKVTAEELYASTLTKSTLSSDLDTAIKDTPDQEVVSVNEQGYSKPTRTVELMNTTAVDPQNRKLVARNCYPSPDRSPLSPPVPALDESLAGENEGVRGTRPPTLAGRKRRFSSSEGVHTPISESSTRPLKRSCYNPFVSSSADACLPSPATSTEELLENDQIPRSDSIPQSLATSRPRKRHLSDADTTDIPKHQRDSMPRPLPHTVSDTFPSTLESERSIDEWFKSNFDDLFALPPPVAVTEPDHSTQWEIQFFNDYTIPADTQHPIALTVEVDQIPSSTCLTTLEDLLHSLGDDGFVASPEMMNSNSSTPSMVPDPKSHDLSLPPDFSQTIDWTTLFNEDSSQSIGISEPMFPRSHFNSSLSEIDLSILQLPQLWTAVTS